jgi:short-subunit dehydrogenase
MAKSLKDRYPGAALITGASAGLGVCFARKVAGEGMDLILVARREEKLRELAADLQREFGVQAHGIAQDLAAPDCGVRLKEAVDAKGLQVSLLINNAGYGLNGPFHEHDAAAEAQMVDLNCRSVVLLNHAFIPPMMARKNGAVIILASTAGFQAMPFFAVYGATKAFDLMLAEALWEELKPYKVDVLGMCPGYTRTEFQEVAGVKNDPPKILWAEPEAVVDTCMKKLGHGPTAIHGGINWFGTLGARLLPRRTITKIAAGFSKAKG